MYTMSPDELKILVQNQEAMKDQAPVTERARYKMDSLMQFLDEVHKIAADQSIRQKFKPQFIDLSVVFVRHKGQDGIPNYHHNLASDKCNGYSPVVPILIPHIFTDNAGETAFAYLRDSNGNIPYFLPGGESTGLVPPPPKLDEDFLQVS